MKQVRLTRRFVITKCVENHVPIPIKYRRLRTTKTLTRETFDFVLGNVLGDGYIHNKKCYLQIDQSIKEYSEWKRAEALRLNILGTSKITETKRKRVDKITGKITHSSSYRFYTSSLFSEWRYLYVEKQPGDPTYGRGDSIFRKRIVPEMEQWFISPYTLAIFYMDDGGIQSDTAYFSTGALPPNEVTLLEKVLKNNFNLEFTRREPDSIDSDSYAAGLLLRKECLPEFIKLIKPTIDKVPCMKYKLDFS